MSSCVRTLSSTAAALALSAVAASADPIQITSGSLVWPGLGSPIEVTLAGEGFTFTAGTNRTEGVFMPIERCTLPECGPGAIVDLLAYAVGNAYSGTATLDGTTYTNVGSLAGPSSIETRWTGELEIPAGFTGGTLFAPFLFAGRFTVDGTATVPGLSVDLFGGGTASLTFSPYGDPQFPNALVLDSFSYDFDAAAPTPEPASLLLMGTGLCAIAAARRRRAQGRP